MAKTDFSTKPITLSVPKPCTASWNEMEAREKGRYCANCQKVVIDFSGLSDKELRDYFSTVTGTHCGRFHHSQLNRNLEKPSAKQKIFTPFYKKFAAVLAFLSFKQTALFAQTQPATSIQPVSKKTIDDTVSHPMVISGTVKSSDGVSLEGAKISFSGKEMATADKEGRFQFVIESPAKPSLLNVSYPDMVTVARSYHPVMGSTDYTITLAKPLHMEPIIMGGISTSLMDSLPSFCFKNGGIVVSSSMQESLQNLAMELRNNPLASIVLVGFATKLSDVKLAKKRQAAIKLYLTENEGISEGRISTRIDGFMQELKNTIEVVSE